MQANPDDTDSIFAGPAVPEEVLDEPGPREPEPLQPFEMKAVVSKSVLCVEAQAEIQDALRKSLTSWGYRALLVSDAETAAERFRESPVDAVIFDIDGQGAESVEAFLDMHETAQAEGQQLLAVVLLGPRQGSLREQLPEDDNLIVLSKPIKMKQVQDALAQLLPPSRKCAHEVVRLPATCSTSPRSSGECSSWCCGRRAARTGSPGSKGRRVPRPGSRELAAGESLLLLPQ